MYNHKSVNHHNNGNLVVSKLCLLKILFLGWALKMLDNLYILHTGLNDEQ